MAAPAAVPRPGITLPIAAPEMAEERALEKRVPPASPLALAISAFAAFCASPAIIFPAPAAASELTIDLNPPPEDWLSAFRNASPVFFIWVSASLAPLVTRARLR